VELVLKKGGERKGGLFSQGAKPPPGGEFKLAASEGEYVGGTIRDTQRGGGYLNPCGKL